MTFDKLVELFKEKSYLLDMGAGKLANRYNTTRDIIYKVKDITRSNISYTTRKFPKILVFDIETSPTISYTWRRFKENISLDQVEQDPIMLTWAAKWLYSTEIMSDAISTKEVLKVDDYRIVKSLWDLVDEADIVIAHYGDYFDIPFLNYRALINELHPFSSTKSIDTKNIASKNFRFPSNKLDGIASYLGFDGKIKTEMQLWVNCIKGDLEAIKNMEIYNIQDVKVLEEVYLKLRPYTRSHPNLGVYIESDVPVCSHCGSEDVLETGKYYYTNAGKYIEYRCSCGALSRGRYNMYNKDKKKNLLISTAK